MENDTPNHAPADPLQLPQATDDNGDRRLKLTVSRRADLAIDRLARLHQIGRRDVIERLVLAADERIHVRMDIDSDDWAHYFGVGVVTL
jgi:hypothetical protein